MHSLKLILSKLRYFAPSWVFTSINIVIGTWVLYIPSVKEKLAMNDSELGIALFSFALGIFLVLPFVPFITKKIGTGKYTIIGIVLFGISFIFPLLAPTYSILCISLFFAGIFSGSTDVAMNALVSEIEKKDSKNFMSAAHGFFSLGGVIGAGIGSLLIGLQINPIIHMISVSIFIIVTNLILAKNYSAIKEESHQDKKSSTYNLKKLKPLFGLAVIAFVIMSSEGAIEHWSNLYLLEVVQVSKKSIAGFGFVFFSIMMTLGRFFGDRISEKIGSLKVIIYGCAIAAIGYAFVLVATLIIAVIGFGIIGLGLSVIIPELFRISGKTEGVSSSVGISFVSGIGFIGFLAGPVVLGFISNSSNLKISFVVLLIVVIVALLLSIINFKIYNLKND